MSDTQFAPLLNVRFPSLNLLSKWIGARGVFLGILGGLLVELGLLLGVFLGNPGLEGVVRVGLDQQLAHGR